MKSHLYTSFIDTIEYVIGDWHIAKVRSGKRFQIIGLKPAEESPGL
jgi:hypothetical protein